MATVRTFVYEAQTPQGGTLSGAVDAATIDAATHQLQLLQLRVTRLEPSEKAPASKTFHAEDFLAFNQQLAQLTAAGIPMERGLRLIAADIGSRRRAAAINRIAAELEKGASFETAFANNKSNFPPLYGKLMAAGIRAGNLPAMLTSIGRHTEMIQRLRAALWRAAAYPLMVLATLLIVLTFIWGWIMPNLPDFQGAHTAYDFFTYRSNPQGGASWMFAQHNLTPIAAEISYGVMGLIAAVLLLASILWLLGKTHGGSQLVEKLVLPIPLVGPILRSNLLSRWCDGLSIGVQAGLDLPASLEIADGAVDSSRLHADTREMIRRIGGGQAIDAGGPYGFLPAIVPTSLQLAAEKNDLPATAATLAKMYQEQTETRLDILPSALTPLLLILVTCCVGLAMVAALLPLVRVLQEFMGP